MRGILARGITSQQAPGALGKCDLIPSNAQTTHHRLEKGRQCRNSVFFGTHLLQQGKTELSAPQVAENVQPQHWAGHGTCWGLAT